MPRVTFVPLGKVRETKRNVTILAAANQSQVPIGQSCSGEGICGWCRVTIVEGIENMAPPTPVEQRLREAKQFAPNERAACLAKVLGDVTVNASYW